MDHKLVLVARNQAYKVRELGNFVKARRGNNCTGRKTLERPTRLMQADIIRDIQPVLYPTTSKLS